MRASPRDTVFDDGTGALTHGFILDVSSAIPEPTSAAGLTLALLALRAPRRSRHRPPA